MQKEETAEELKVLSQDQESLNNGPVKVIVTIGCKNREHLESNLRKKVWELAKEVAEKILYKKCSLSDTGKIFAVNKKGKAISPASAEPADMWCVKVTLTEAI